MKERKTCENEGAGDPVREKFECTRLGEMLGVLGAFAEFAKSDC